MLAGCSLDDWQAIVGRAVTDAKGGDAKAREWLARHLIGTPDGVATLRDRHRSRGWNRPRRRSGQQEAYVPRYLSVVGLARREHRVPLVDAAMAVLEALRRIEGNPYIFPGTLHGRPLSNMALLQLERGMGYGVNGSRGDYVPHGFRSSFRDWSGDVSSSEGAAYPVATAAPRRDACRVSRAA